MTDENVQMLSPLHTMLRTWDFIVKLICLLRAEVYIFSIEPNVLKEKYKDYKTAKKDLIDKVKEKVHIIIEVPDAAGKGGTSTNGNTVCKLLSKDENRQLLASLVPQSYKNAMEDILLRMWLIMKTYNSNEEVNEYFSEFCKETCILLLTSFNKNEQLWIYLTPTVHGLLNHTWELIQGNSNFGLQEYSESSFEGNMKFLRFYRQFLASF